MKNRDTNRVQAEVVESTNKETLQSFVTEYTSVDATVYTDEALAYRGLPRMHQTVSHSTGEYVREMAHTKGMESFWSMLKRGYVGTYHHIRPKHLHRYVDEYSGRHNVRPMDTVDQMAFVVRQAAGNRLTYRELIQ